MKGLYLAFETLSASSGISKKIISQKKALEYNGFEMKLAHIKENSSGFRFLTVDDNVIASYGKGIGSKINYYIRYNNLFRYILNEKIDFLYIRYVHYATPFFVNFLKKLHKNNVRLLLEIPTYPYDAEYRHRGLPTKMKMLIEKMSRKSMSKYLERIVTVSEHDFIFGVPTVKISNGIDVESVIIKKKRQVLSNTLQLIGVVSVARWHGFDRLILGLARYYKKEVKIPVFFNIISGKGDRETLLLLKQLVETNVLYEYVKFSGAVFGEPLDNLFDESDMGIGSLGCHRIGISDIRVLKNREYAARGIPFCYSGNDIDFDGKPYTLKVPADETPIDIESLVTFYQSLSLSPKDIRASVKDFISWNVQMSKVAKFLM